jgi:signal transduction histidine kinase/ligand-binding sensor domain-containing protein/DNA-binding response OmpR family regulator
MQKELFLILISLMFSAVARAADPELWIKSLSIENGLSESSVQCILQDRKGLIWMGTRDGLNRYDGYDFIVYNYDESNPMTVSSNFINCLFEDSEGRIWVGTNANGVCYYSYDSDNFTRINDAANDEFNLTNTNIWDILEDKDGNIWIATQDGLFQYSVSKDRIVQRFVKSSRPGAISDNNIRTLALDSTGNLWLGTDDGGICQFNHLSNQFNCFTNSTNDPNSLSSNHIRKIHFQSDSLLWVGTIDKGFNQFNIFSFRNKRYGFFHEQDQNVSPYPQITGFLNAQDGKLWISTENQGVKLFDPQDASYITYEHSSYSANSISSNSITCLYKSRDGIIWAGAMGYGVNYFFTNNHGVKGFEHNPFDPSSLSHNNVRCIFQNQNGDIWVGTDGGGIDIFDSEMRKINEINSKTTQSYFRSNVVLGIKSDSKGNIWFATWGDGLIRYDAKTRQLHKYLNIPGNPKSVRSNFILNIYVDGEDNLWVSCYKEGLAYKAADSDFFESVNFVESDDYERELYYITGILVDTQKNVWISTFNGLFLKKGNAYLSFRHNMNDTSSISSNIIYCTFEDSKGRIWIGTNNKLNLYDPVRRIFLKYGNHEGFPSNVIYNIIEDDFGYLWLSTNKGIIRYHPDEGTVKKYSTHHGLLSSQLNPNSSFKINSGQLLFGGISGFNIIDPAHGGWKKDNPTVLLTNFYQYNQLQRPGAENSPLSQHISKIPELVLRHSEKVFTLEFVGLNYFSPNHTEYAYRLKGFEKDWNFVGADKQATYTNLNHGKYVFEVMAKETDQEWQYDVTSINITILPPFWKTGIAYFIYILIIFSSVIFLRLLILNKERIKMKEKFDLYRVKKSQEMEAMRIRFFTNISHDLRTPLTLILAPFENLLKTETNEEKKYQISVVHKNALRLERLINQLLDLRKQETSSLKLNLNHGDIHLFLSQIIESFQDLAHQKNIRLSIESNQRSLYLLFDHDKLDKIMYNLLSNAFKFTLDGGKITVRVDVSDAIPGNSMPPSDFDKYLCIDVADTGKGIPSELHEKVFERFYHMNDVTYTGIEGAGIGLSLSKDFVELHGGRIILDSEPGKGSHFKVYIPLLHAESKELPMASDEDMMDELGTDVKEFYKEKPVVLIVEDNFELRDYMCNTLGKEYTVVASEDGELGLTAAFENIPDIIITDIMMPKLDGIEMTKMLKSDLRTSHIPVILLTARSADVEKLEGLNVGADDYITKPFSFELLEARMQNLMQMRELFREKYSKLIKLQPTEIEVENQDEKFLRKVMKIVNDHIPDSEFSVEKLSSELGLSRVHLYRKLSALINETPVEFIRNSRLERGAQLLRKSRMNISEVCYEVGFQNPVYFSKCFKKKYGVLPSEYIIQ